MVTIVIPCYNVSKYIARCIDSLISQSFQQFKVILVDDASTDDTYQQLLQLKATSGLNMSILQNAHNGGPAVSRNRGIMAADTKYITFCDSDDWYELDFLETMVELLEGNAADIAFCGYKIVDENGDSQSRPVYKRSGLISRGEAFCMDADSLCMLMVKTDIMKDTLLPDLRNGEDVATVPFLMAKANRYAATDACLYNYFRRSDSASEKPTMKAVNSLVCSYQFVQKNFPDKYRKEKEFLGIKNLLYSTMITLFSCSNNRSMAKRLLKEFENNYPNWINNPYIGSLRMYKKIVLFMLHYRCYFGLKLVSFVRSITVK